MENQKYEQKDLTGTIWMEVQQKEGKEGPYEVRTGSCKILGIEYWINAYAKTTQSGKELLSLSFKPKQDRPATQTDLVNLDKAPF